MRCAKLLFELGYALALTATPAALGGCSGDASLGADGEPYSTAATAGSKDEPTSSPESGHAGAGGRTTDRRTSGGVDGGRPEQADAHTSGGSTGTSEGGAVSTSAAPTGGTASVPEQTGGAEVAAGSDGIGGASTGGQQQGGHAGQPLAQDTGGQPLVQDTGGQPQANSAGMAGASVEAAAGWGGALSDPGGAGPTTGGSNSEVCTVTECAVRRPCVQDCSHEEVTSTCCVCETLGMIDRRTCL